MSAWFGSRWRRLNGGERLGGIDLARGLAVVGMFAAHMFALPELRWSDPGTWGALAEGRSSILFATVAGVSLALVTGGPEPMPGPGLALARSRIAVRAGLIWILGLLLIATTVPVYVILPAYAILFVLALPFLALRAGALLCIAAILGVVMPFVQVYLDALPVWGTDGGAALSPVLGWHYPFPVWIAFLVCGLGLGRLPLRSGSVPLVLLIAGSAAAFVGYGLDAIGATGASDVWGQVWTARPHSSGLLEVVGSGGFAVAVVGLSLLICRTPLTWVLLPLRATGGMPLTAYTSQLLGWAVVSGAVLGSPRDLTGFRALEPFVPFMVWTILGCTAWACLIGRGPLEAVVDRLTRRLTARVAPDPLARVDR